MPDTFRYDPEARYEVTVSDVEYRRDDDKVWLARVFTPQAPGPFPVLLDIHGGAWNTQDRKSDEPLNLALAASGLLVVAPDFRLAPEHPYPAQIVDVHYCIRWVKAHASELGGTPAGLGVLGTSSGGHTALLIAMRPEDPRYAALPLPEAPDADARPAYVVSNSAVIDPYARYMYAKGSGIERLATSTEAYFLNEAAMHEGNPQEILDREEQVELPPVLVIHSTADKNVPDEIPERFVTSYRAAGGHVHFDVTPGMHHVFIRDPSPQAERARGILKQFIAEQLMAATAPQSPLR